MDVDQARELAIAEMTRRAATSQGSSRVDSWQVSGPYELEVYGLRGPRPCLVFDFVPPEAEAPGNFRLRIGVDKETGETDMLR